MNELYSEKDLRGLNTQLKKRYALLGCGLAVILAGIVWSFVTRTEWMSMLFVFLFFAAAVFVIVQFFAPLQRYRQLITAALGGRTHTETQEFSDVEAEESMVEGIRCRGLIFLGEADKHGTREQRWYWDAEIPIPEFRPGEAVTLKYTGKNIIGYRREASTEDPSSRP